MRGAIEEVDAILAGRANIACWWPAPREARPVDLGDAQAGCNAVYMLVRGWRPSTRGFRSRLLESHAPTYLRGEAQGEWTAKESRGGPRTDPGWTRPMSGR